MYWDLFRLIRSIRIISIIRLILFEYHYLPGHNLIFAVVNDGKFAGLAVAVLDSGVNKYQPWLAGKVIKEGAKTVGRSVKGAFQNE